MFSCERWPNQTERKPTVGRLYKEAVKRRFLKDKDVKLLYTMLSLVHGRVSSIGFLPMEPRVSKNRDTLSSSKVAVPPEEVLFRRKGAPVRYEENDFYWADRHLKEGQILPESDLLKAIHTYASDYYERSTMNKGAADFESLDETALLALGIVLEEMAGHVLGETGDLAFTEGEEIEEQDEDEDEGAEEEQQPKGREAEESSTVVALEAMPEAIGDPGEKRERKRRKIEHEATDAG